MLSAYTLFSGSSGNCTYVKSGSTEILIDAGKSALAIEHALNELGSSLEFIKAIFVTHEHSDHICGLEIISKKYKIPVHMTYPSYDKTVKCNTFLSEVACRHEINYEKEIDNIKIKSFEIPHDSAKNVGYIISDTDDCIGTATDIGHITDEIAKNLINCRCVILEANHDVEMLKSGPYPSFLKNRILSKNGHLSNKNCALLSCYLAENGVKCLTLAHLSKENNTHKLAYDTVFELLERNNLSIDLRVAKPDTPVLVTRTI